MRTLRWCRMYLGTPARTLKGLFNRRLGISRTWRPCAQLCRHELRILQDPSSMHLGLTVWDASIVCAKYLEKVGVYIFCAAPCVAVLDCCTLQTSLLHYRVTDT